MLSFIEEVLDHYPINFKDSNTKEEKAKIVIRSHFLAHIYSTEWLAVQISMSFLREIS